MSGILTRLLGGTQRRDSSGSWISEDAFTSLVALLNGAAGGYAFKTASGTTITPDTAMQTTAVYACVRILSESVASLPLITYRRLEDGGKERAPDFYLYPILHALPNPEMTSFELFETLMGHLALWGNAYCEIEMDGAGRVRALWPLRPDRMEIKRDRETQQIVYEYMLPNSSQPVTLSSERVMHLKGLSVSGMVGLSPIAMARQSIGLALATEEFGARFYSNNAQPGGVLEHPGKLGDEAYGRLKTSWTETHAGLSNAHRVAILEEGMKFEKIGIPPNDAQFLETRKYQTTEIARVFRIPPHMLADLDRATFSNIEQQSLEFVIHTIRPWLVRIEQSIVRSLLTEAERRVYFAEFLVDGLLRGDTQSRYSAYAIGRQWGWLSVNDVRGLENMNPVEDGDDYLVPMNMTTLGAPTPDTGVTPEAEEPVQEPAIAEGETEEDIQRSIAAMSHVYRDAMQRIAKRVTRDTQDAARKHLAAGNVDKFNDWLDQFSLDLRQFIEKTLIPVAHSHLEVFVWAGTFDSNAAAAARIVRAWSSSYMTDLLTKASGCATRARLNKRDVVSAFEAEMAFSDEIVDGWVQDLAQTVANEVRK